MKRLLQNMGDGLVVFCVAMCASFIFTVGLMNLPELLYFVDKPLVEVSND